jgi:hypothetical protein
MIPGVGGGSGEDAETKTAGITRKESTVDNQVFKVGG